MQGLPTALEILDSLRQVSGEKPLAFERLVVLRYQGREPEAGVIREEMIILS